MDLAKRPGAGNFVGFRPETCLPGHVNVTLNYAFLPYSDPLYMKQYASLMLQMTPEQAKELGEFLVSCSQAFRGSRRA